MSELLTIIAVLDGVTYIYKFMKILGVTYAQQEVLHKIHDSIDLVGEIKNIKNPKSIHMGKLTKLLTSISENYQLYQAQKSEKRAFKHMEVLKSSEELKKDKLLFEKEKELFELGYLKDIESQTFVSRETMLNDINTMVLSKMTDVKWTPVHKLEITELVKGDNDDFSKYEDLFRCLKIMDRTSKEPFKSQLIKGNVSSIENIKWLKLKAKTVYVDKPRVQFENNVIA